MAKDFGARHGSDFGDIGFAAQCAEGDSTAQMFNPYIRRTNVFRTLGFMLPDARMAMNLAEVRQKLKELIVSELNLEGKSPEDIEDAAPLFGAGLGLDSLDALQLAMSIEEVFGVRIPEGDEARSIFASVEAIATHIVRVKAAN